MGGKKVLFIITPYLIERGELPSSKLRSFSAFPYGVLSMATYIKKNSDHVVKIFDCNLTGKSKYIDKLEEELESFNPDVLGISMMFDNSYKHIRDISEIAKRINPSIRIVMGGAASISSYSDILKEQELIDAICFYDGELPLLRLLDGEDVGSDDAWITRESLDAGVVPRKSVVPNLDNVMDIDYTLVDVGGYKMREAFSPFAIADKNSKQFFVVTSRGCPFKCVFCMRSADSDKSMRYASVDKVIEHVKFLIDTYGMTILTFYDDQILLDRKRARRLFRELGQFNLRVECPNGLSVAYMDDELIELMRLAGMDTANLAIESGSEYVLNKIVHKPLKLDMVKPVVDSLRKHGMWSHGFFVSGLPGEKDNHREETVEFIKYVGLDWSGFSLANPSRGSSLYKICEENGYIPSKIGIGELDANKYIINTGDYSPEDVIRKTYTMNLDVNFVNNHRMKIGDYDVASRAFLDVIARNDDHAFAYFYLSKCLEKLGEESGVSMGKFKNIIDTNPLWNSYADHFGIMEDLCIQK